MGICKRRNGRLGVALGCLWLLAGCSEPAGPGVPEADAPATAAVFRRGMNGEPDSLDPHRSVETSTHDLLRDLYDGLTVAGPDGRLHPAAAESWRIEEKGRVYRFRLRSDGRWSNGDPVVAEDFAAALRRAVDPATGSRQASLLAPIENAPAIVAGELPPETLGVAAPSTLELEIRLTTSTPYFLGLLSNPVTFPVHRPTLERHGERFARAGNLVSNGPFMLDDWVVNDRLRLVRNPHFRDPGSVGLDVVYYHPLNESAELQRYRADELDFTQSIPNTRYAWVREQFGDELVVAPYLGVYYYMLNTTRPPFDDERLRRALTLAVDRRVLTEQVTGVGELPAYSFVPPGVHAYSSQAVPWAGWEEARRLAEARRLYAAAGYGAETPLRFELIYNTGHNHRKVALAVASMWKEALGVLVEPVNMELKVMLDRRRDRGAWTVMRLGWTGDYNDASNFLEILQSGHSQNDTGYSDPEYDRLLQQAAGEIDMARRGELLAAAERRMLEAAPVVPLYFYVTKHLVKPWVRGFAPNVLDHNNSRYLSIDAERRMLAGS